MMKLTRSPTQCWVQERTASAWDAVFRQGRVKLPVAVPKARAHAPVKAVMSIVRAATCLSIAVCRSCVVKVLPRRNQVIYNEVNLDQLSQAFKADADVNPETLEKAHLLRDSRNPVVVLGPRRDDRCPQGACSSRQRGCQSQDRKGWRLC